MTAELHEQEIRRLNAALLAERAAREKAEAELHDIRVALDDATAQARMMPIESAGAHVAHRMRDVICAGTTGSALLAELVQLRAEVARLNGGAT